MRWLEMTDTTLATIRTHQNEETRSLATFSLNVLTDAHAAASSIIFWISNGFFLIASSTYRSGLRR
jgi:hypothetical protein